MNATSAQHRMTQDMVPQGPDGSSLFVSVSIHLFLIILAIVGLPHLTKPVEMIATPVPIEIVPIGEITTTNKPPVEAPKPKDPPKEEPKPVQKKEAPKPPAPPKVEAKEPPKPKPAEPPKEKPKPAEKPVAQVPPPDAKPLEKPVETPPAPPQPQQPQQVQEDNSEAFDSLLRNLQDSEPVIQDAPTVDAPAEPPIPSPIGDFSKQLLVSEADALRQQLSQCWSIQAGGRYAENLVVEVRLTINRDRTVQNAVVVDRYRYNSDPAFRAAADSAVRAVLSPMCTPLRLPPEKYEGWKDTIVNFDPKDML